MVSVYQLPNRGWGAITCSLVVQQPLTLPDFHLRNHFFASSLLRPEQGLHSPGPRVALQDRLHTGSNAKDRGDSAAEGVS